MPYMAYLLRLWSSEREGRRLWRASLENAHSAERHIFPDLEALIAFLEHRIEYVDSLNREGQTPLVEGEDSQGEGMP